MSLNLTCEEVRLRQTPTAVTVKAMERQEAVGWVGAFAVYLTWYIASVADDDNARWHADQHIQELAKALAQHGQLTFSYI